MRRIKFGRPKAVKLASSGRAVRISTPKAWTSEAYGEDWKELAEACKRRDGYKCCRCGATRKDVTKSGDPVRLNAHHIIPLPRGRNVLSNLKTLCEDCHELYHPHMRRRMK